MKKMFLASSFADVAGLFAKFSGGNCEGKSVTFIPTASLVEEVNFYVEEGKKALEQMGLIVDELEISTAGREEIERKLQNNDFIYVTGGNTFFLLQELKRTGTDKLIAEQVESGKIYIGESAGSIVLSGSIEYINGLDDVAASPNLASFSALGIVNIYPLPHYTNFPFKEAVDEIIATYKGKLDLWPISNEQAIIVNDNEYEVWTTDSLRGEIQ